MTGRSSLCPELAAHPPGDIGVACGLVYGLSGRNVSEWCCQRYHKTGRVKKDHGCQPACAVPHSLSHGHGPGGTGANSALYSPLGKMHDEVVIIVLDESQDACLLML